MSVTLVSQAREDRGRGIPLTDEERRMRHYEQTGEWLTFLPQRGTGLEQIGQIGQVHSEGFWSDTTMFLRTYPWQTAMVLVAIIVIVINIRSTRQMVRALQIKRR